MRFLCQLTDKKVSSGDISHFKSPAKLGQSKFLKIKISTAWKIDWKIDRKWTGNRPEIDQKQTKNRPKTDQKQTRNKPETDQKQTGNRLEVTGL